MTAGSTLQSGARNATDNFNRFVEGDDHVPSRRPQGGDSSRDAEPERKDFWDSFGQTDQEPEKKDFWESFGQPAAGGPSKGSLGTGAMKGSGGGVASRPKAKGEEGWGDEW